jgi:D-glycero-D-manno-heptose 1,7-bisphosphate phosphatase
LEGSRIVNFAASGDADKPALINGGIYLLSREIVNQIGDGQVSLETTVFPALAAQGRLGGIAYDGYFIDIGVPESYQRAQTELAAQLR